MALDLDAFAVLRAIGAQEALFDVVRTDAAKSARTLVVKLIKSKGTDLATARALYGALGHESFALIVDGLKDAELKSLTTRFDKENIELKGANGALRRRHLLALATGSVQPAPKAPKAPKTAKAPARKKVAKTPEFLFDESAGAVRKR